MTTTKKIALVTGGSRGLGKEIALQLAKEGNDVIITYATQQDAALETVKQISAMGVKAVSLHLNLAKRNNFKEFGLNLSEILQTNFNTNKFDYLVNNAGMGATVPFEQVTEDVFDDFLNVHFKGVYFLTQASLGLMNTGGSIVNVSSGTTRFCIPGYSVYASMKSAIEVFTKYLAKELGAKQIRANVVAPGPVETDFNNAAIRSNPVMKAMLSGLSPLGRVGQPDDISTVVSFLCSDASKWVNGQRIEVSGGINV